MVGSEFYILVVEDEPTIQMLLNRKLSNKKYNVKIAGNGQEALDLIDVSIPDLILSDVTMPVMDGFTLRSKLKEQRHTSVIPFIYLTALDDDKSESLGRNFGVDDYITKPIDWPHLFARLESVLERVQLHKNNFNGQISLDFSRRLIPQTTPQVDAHRIDFRVYPKVDGGGDMFDWYQLADGSYIFSVGDVMGKGLKAKFYAYSFLAYIRASLRALLKETVSPGKLLTHLNRLLLEDEILQETFLTLMVIHWNPKTNKLTYANAAHCRPLLIGQNKGQVLDCSGLNMGLNPFEEYEDETITLQPGDVFMAYTDALTEHEYATSHEQLGEEPVVTAMEAAQIQDSPPIDFVLDEIKRVSGTPVFGDDVLVFWLERLPEESLVEEG